MEPLERSVLAANMDYLKGWGPGQRKEITRADFEAGFNDIEWGQCFGAPNLIDVSMCVSADEALAHSNPTVSCAYGKLIDIKVLG